MDVLNMGFSLWFNVVVLLVKRQPGALGLAQLGH
jgi:hypothetical protein